MVEAEMHSNTVQPRIKARTTVKTLQSAIRLQKCLLCQVFGIVSTQGDAVGQAIDVLLVLLDKGIEGRHLARQEAINQLKITLPLRWHLRFPSLCALAPSVRIVCGHATSSLQRSCGVMYSIRDDKYNQCYTTLAFFLCGYPQFGVNNTHFFHRDFPSLPSMCGRTRISRRVALPCGMLLMLVSLLTRDPAWKSVSAAFCKGPTKLRALPLLLTSFALLRPLRWPLIGARRRSCW